MRKVAMSMPSAVAMARSQSSLVSSSLESSSGRKSSGARISSQRSSGQARPAGLLAAATCLLARQKATAAAETRCFAQARRASWQWDFAQARRASCRRSTPCSRASASRSQGAARGSARPPCRRSHFQTSRIERRRLRGARPAWSQAPCLRASPAARSSQRLGGAGRGGGCRLCSCSPRFLRGHLALAAREPPLASGSSSSACSSARASHGSSGKRHAASHSSAAASDGDSSISISDCL
mmetsp:Transcript_74082/g.217058  ORF Transcript_74082/g.217058 Transcript_74082/m.217058 type:complete len:239 (+) Transcript_74082:359-1075(+)